MRLFRNPKGAVYGIIAFVVLLLMLFAMRARSEQTLQLEAGAAVLPIDQDVLARIDCVPASCQNQNRDQAIFFVG